MKNIPYKVRRLMNKKRQMGFSLLEILIYTAIVGTVTTFLGGVLVSVTKIQSRTSASVEVNQQLNFVLNTIQRLVGESSVVDVPSGTATSTLTLRMQADSSDPTSIYLQNNTIYLKQGIGTSSPLTSDQVAVNKLEFLKTSQYPGHDAVQVDLTVGYNTQNPELTFSKTLSSAIARVSAATFDSDLVPGADNTYDIGLGITRWQDMSLSGNLLVGGNVGVGTVAPAVGLHLGTAASSHSLSASNDMIVSGKLEVNDFIYSDKGIDIGTAVGGYGILANGNVIIKSWATGTQVDPVLITGGATDKTVIIGPGENHNLDFGHGAQTNPTLFIHSVLSPATNNTRWLSLKHTGTSGSAGYGLINTGSGDLILQPSGSVGIGTANPSEKLHVAGNILADGFIKGSQLCIGADCRAVWPAGGGGGGIGGSGTANYVAKFTDATNLGNSQIFDDGSKISVAGNVAVGGGMGGTTGKYLELPSLVNDFIRISGEYVGPDTSNGYFISGDNIDDGWYFQNVDCCGAGTVNYMRIAKNAFWYNGTGNVGIGTITPAAKLHISAGDGSLAYFGPNASWDGRLYVGASPNVSGTKTAQVISTDGNLHLDNANAKTMYLNYYQSGNIVMANAGGNVGVGMAPAGRLSVSVPANSRGIESLSSTAGDTHLPWSNNWNYISGNGVIFRDASNVEKMRIDATTGNVGIGMSPSYRLDVNGQTRTTDIYLTDGVKIEGLSGRNYFRDVEAAGDLRVGAAWGMPGVYAESGVGVLGGAGGASLQNNSLFVTTGGKIGIGTTDPGLLPYIGYPLVDAELRVAGDVMINGYIAGATYGFGGLYQIDDCGVNNVFNWLSQGFSCPAGFTARQYGRVRTPESNCGASQYVCIKASGTVSP